jgi:cytochrome P450
MNEKTVIAKDLHYEDLYEIERGSEYTGASFIDDPYPAWAELRAKGSVHRGTVAECMGLAPETCGNIYVPGLTYYTVFSFNAVSDVFTRRDDFSSEFYYDIHLPEQFGDSILNMDGLRHRRYRDLIQAHFQPAAADSWWRTKVISCLVDELIGAFEKEDSVELNARFFSRLPLQVVTSGFGMSMQDGLEFRHHMKNAIMHGATPVQMKGAMEDAGRVLERVIRARQADSQDDIISRLAHAELREEDGHNRKLTIEEIASFCRLIVFAGSETTWRQLGNATFALLNHPDQFSHLIRDRSLLTNTVLESTRWQPDPVFARKVKRDTVLESVELPKGAALHLCLGAANRDPSRWENPEKFDIHRPVHRSVTFAAGHHSCLGQHVARQEVAVALSALMDRFPNMRWDSSKPPAKIIGGFLGRGPGPMHVLLH